MTTPDDALTRIQLLDRHAKDHAPFVETELRFAAGLLVRLGVSSSPATQSRLRCDGGVNLLGCRLDWYLMLHFCHVCFLSRY